MYQESAADKLTWRERRVESGMVIGQRRAKKRTNNAAMTQLPHGNFSMPSFAGKVNMIYSSTMKPGASIVAQAILPGMLRREVTDVLPAG